MLSIICFDLAKIIFIEMNINFQFQSLDRDLFASYFQMSGSQLKSIGAYVFESDECPCYPCRVSLADAKVGENVLAINFEHLAVDSPYRSSGPIFVRENSQTRKMEQNEIPVMLKHRLLSVRGYSENNLMIKADTVAGEELENIISGQFSDELVQYIHVHNAGPGCFNCSITRA